MKNLLLAILVGLILSGCVRSSSGPTLVSLQIVDRQGMQETVSQKERLERFRQVDFMAAQPYEKVLCQYQQKGRTFSQVITYHKNGQPRQRLEVIGGRAHGMYREYFDSGNLKLEAQVLEGVGDLTPYAQDSWVFEGISRVYYENGGVQATISYQKGALEGESCYFAPEGFLTRKVHFVGGERHGKEELFSPTGALVGEIPYVYGKRHGRAWMTAGYEGLVVEELYQQGDLIEATYRTAEGELLSEVTNGDGERTFFIDGRLAGKEEVRNGVLEGKVSFFSPTGTLEHSFMQKRGMKEGEEWFFYKHQQPKLLVPWEADHIHGVVKSWYENGVLESERSYAQNKKQGTAFAWYQDGDRMLVEEYENDLLIQGRYYKRGEADPVSRVKEGAGTVMLYDSKGNFLKKISYQKGLPHG